MKTESALLSQLKAACEVAVFLAGAVVMNAAAMDAAQGTAAAAKATAATVTERELIPGAEWLNDAERDAYRRRMAAAATPEEKAKIRAEYAKAAELKDGAGKAAGAPALVGDAAWGANLHQGCFGCHGIERYVAPVTYAMATFTDSVLRASGLSDIPPVEPKRFKGRAASLASLREGVIRRNEFLNPKMTPQEIEDVVAYLNAAYYKFQQ